MRRSKLLVSLVVLTILGGAPRTAPAQPSNDAAVSSALRTMFSPRRSPPYRTMGLSQRTFLDLVEQSRPKLQVAFVIDATDSMSAALDGVRGALAQMMDDLELYDQSEITYQLVVYRDAGAPSGEVAFPLNISGNGFTDDRQAVVEAIGQLEPESGAPYFPELIDEGVSQALNRLAWSDDDQTSRWILLFGDAPPFNASVDEPQTGATRRVATDALVALASSKGVQVNCVLCAARDEDKSAYEAVLDETRTFMSTLSSGTGGLMLDLSYDDIRAAMVDAAKGQEVEYAEVGSIRREDVERARAILLEPASPSDAPVTLAILPHEPLDRVDFATDAPATQLAAELRLRVKSIPGITVVEPLVVQRSFDRLRRNPNYSGLRGQALLQALGRTVGAEYVLWGDLRDRGAERTVQTRMYDTTSGEVIADASRATGPGVRIDQIGARLASDMLSASIAAGGHRSLAGHLLTARNDAARRSVVTRQITTGRAHADLVSGLAALEKALAYPVGDAEGDALLDRAQQRLERAVDADDTNAFPHFLLASCHYNLAKRLQLGGGDWRGAMRDFGRQLRSAYRFRNSLPSGEVRQEIEADYALLVRKRPQEAIPIYERLADSPVGDDTAKRANWMLAGIYGGDWGVGEEFVDQAKARNRLIRVLARWPDSSEARFIKRVLRWDEQGDGTRFEHLPMENAALADQVEREV